MRANVGPVERATRWAIGIMMTAIALSGVASGVGGTVLFVLGPVLIVTGVSGGGPLYRAFGRTTFRGAEDDCSHLLEQPGLQSEPDELGSVVEAELFHNSRAVRVHRLGRDE